MEIGMTLRTNYSEVAVGFGVSFNLPEPSILDESEYAAAIATPVAEGWNAGHGRLGVSVNPMIKVQKLMAQGECTYGRSRYL
jgi:hypothetical protein